MGQAVPGADDRPKTVNSKPAGRPAAVKASAGHEILAESEPERARRTLSGGVLLFRWVAFIWMAALNLAHANTFRRPLLAWAGIAAAGLFTLWLTATRTEPRAQERRGVLSIDLALSAGLIVMAGYVMRPQAVTGTQLFYATAYPLSTALAWGAALAIPGAIEAALVLSAALVVSRPINGVALGDLSGGQVLGLVNGFVNYLLAAGIAGVVSRHLDRSSVQLRAAIEAAIGAREKAARLAERESLARAIHDSVLQALALVHKRGKELAERGSVPGPHVGALAEMAAEQERELRTLLLRAPEEPPKGAASLREALEDVGRRIAELPVTVSAVGPLWLPTEDVDEMCAAVRQALANVIEHAGAGRAAVFAEAEEGWVIVSVRDDGQGFHYSEQLLDAAGKAGMLKSMKGRIEGLGGKMRVMSAPGAGTEIEFRIPVRENENQSGSGVPRARR